MKLQKRRRYTSRKGKAYYTYEVTLPPALVEHNGWRKGTQLEAIEHPEGVLVRREQK